MPLDVPTPIASFVPFRRHGELIYLAGQVCEWNGDVRFVGKVGADVGGLRHRVKHLFEGGHAETRAVRAAEQQ